MLDADGGVQGDGGDAVLDGHRVDGQVLDAELEPLLVLLKETPLRPVWTADFRTAVLLAASGAGSSLVKAMMSVPTWPAWY